VNEVRRRVLHEVVPLVASDQAGLLGEAPPPGLSLQNHSSRMNTHALFKLQGCVQHYDWGGFDFIPKLLGAPHPAPRPCAEFWLGVHASGPSLIMSAEGSVPLPEFIKQSPEGILGCDVAARFGNHLPYLLKILDARKMLSIQAHPTLSQARDGFAAEELAGVPLTASTRNYKDTNHKPEVHVALTDFWMLHGFRPLEEIAAILAEHPGIRSLFPTLRAV
jgi:mannose-6-phosphate isomerase